MLEVFLGHPGGPFWAKKDDGVWTIPKGELGADESPLDAARREFREETGFDPPERCFPLATIRQSRKHVHAWAAQGDCDPALLRSSEFTVEWPPKSGTLQKFPELDRAAWFPVEQAMAKILPSQQELIRAIEAHVASER